ncbi:hypothetical protein CPB83DRAFT_854140 [Crepidotus variabilis]|uniref:Uncharacterized protein n=1 Tax=Crepidotus variabilis TaxID=179855 RepID=A0A9P6EGN5_9AGAR|nr:hypothetical protein CPB83DRAFT_854140 [Crepidotus variabilis]
MCSPLPKYKSLLATCAPAVNLTHPTNIVRPPICQIPSPSMSILSNRICLTLLLSPLLFLAYQHREAWLNWFRSPFSTSEDALQKAIKAYNEYQSDPTSAEAESLLQEAIHFYGIAFENSNERHGLYLAISINYAAALDKLKERTPDYAGPIAIDVLSKPADVFSERKDKPELYATVLINLGMAYLNRFTESSNPKRHDLDSASQSFKLVQSISGQNLDLQYSRSLLGSASITCKRCGLPNPLNADFAKLHDAIKQVHEVLQRHPEDLGGECYSLLATAHDHLYRRTKKTTMDDQPPDLSNLDQAIHFNELCLEVSQDLTEARIARFNLARQQFQRHIKTHPVVETYLHESETNIEKVEDLIKGEGALSGNLAELCSELRGNIEKYRKHQPVADYELAPPVRRKTLPASGSHEPTNVHHVQFTITEEPGEI